LKGRFDVNFNPPATIDKATITETDAIALLNTTRDLAETLNATLESTEGAGRNEIAKALANLLNAVAKRIEQ
jgi:hypothetical protein